MTAHYDRLSERSSIFGQLRNLMDLCVVAAVIDKNDLDEKAGLDLSALASDEIPLRILRRSENGFYSVQFHQKRQAVPDYRFRWSADRVVAGWQRNRKSIHALQRPTKKRRKRATLGGSSPLEESSTAVVLSADVQLFSAGRFLLRRAKCWRTA